MSMDISTDGSSVLLESSLEDVSEEQLLNEFVSEGCGCTLDEKVCSVAIFCKGL